MCSDLGSASQCCAYYSVIGVFFMVGLDNKAHLQLNILIMQNCSKEF